jgi:hypothetical protein
LPRSFWLAAALLAADLKPADIHQLSGDNEAVVSVGKIVRVEVTASMLFAAG